MGPNNIFLFILIFFVISDIFSGHPPWLISLLLSIPFPSNLFVFAVFVVFLLYSLIIHEVAHAWVADKMGDATARWLGRLSLDPRKHLDLIGTLMIFISRFGWAKPVPINFNNIQPFRKGIIFVSAAGVVANIIVAFLALFLRQLLQTSGVFDFMLRELAFINIGLAAFNLIPIPPLDGSKILMGFGSRRLQYSIMQLEPYGFFIIVGLLFMGVLNYVAYPFLWVIINLITLILA